MIDISTVSLLDLLPPNLRADPIITAAAQALDSEGRDIAQTIKNLTYMNRLDDLTSQEADELAWQFHVDFYNPLLPLEQRRQLVISSYAWHKRKGTPSAVEELIAVIFGAGEVLEWFNYGGEPGYFKVVTSDPEATTSRADEFLKAVNSVKNVRSWLEAVEITTESVMPLYFAGVIQEGEYMQFRLGG